MQAIALVLPAFHKQRLVPQFFSFLALSLKNNFWKRFFRKEYIGRFYILYTKKRPKKLFAQEGDISFFSAACMTAKRKKILSSDKSAER